VKKVHLRKRHENFFGEFIVAPLCHVQNLTWAYTASTNIKEVTCEKCLTKWQKIRSKE
jgi:hypothetical protein